MEIDFGIHFYSFKNETFGFAGLIIFFVAIVLIAFFLRSASCCCVTNTNSSVSNKNVLNNNAAPTSEISPMIQANQVPSTKRSTIARIFRKNTEPLIISDDEKQKNQTPKSNRFSRLFGNNNKADSITVVIPDDEKPTRSRFFSAMSFWKKSSDNNDTPQKSEKKTVRNLAAMYEMK